MTNVERYGDLIAESITEWLGERCPEYEKGCACCEAWKQYDALKARAEAAEKERDMLKAALERRGEIIFGKEGD